MAGALKSALVWVGLGSAIVLGAGAQTASPLVGDWREPGGSVISVQPCGSELCLRLAAISRQAPSPFDVHNPQKAERGRRLCGLVIGRGFQPTSPEHAEGGTLYDPKSGKTYHGQMTVEGGKLELRGYVGIPLFGRTETWVRSARTPPCAKT